MKRTILLPTDFSDNAWSAAVYALKLYAKEPCTFYFIHSIDMKVSAMSSMSSKLSRVMAEQASKDLDKLKAAAKEISTNPEHHFETVLSSLELIDAMDVEIEKSKIDLIIMGTKGATKGTEIVFGSNTVNLIKKVKKCPILVVPDKFDYVNPDKIAFPTDFSRFYGDEITALQELAKLHNSKIKIVHINKKDELSESQDYHLEQLKIALKDYPHSFHWVPGDSKKDKVIRDFIEEYDINILVMINYKHSFIENIVKEPVIKNLGFHPTIPFLVIPCLG
ncbi:universal stress protein [Winogradskyella sp. PC D3.3]